MRLQQQQASFFVRQRHPLRRMSLLGSAEICPLSGPASRRFHRRVRPGQTTARTSNKCCLKRGQGKEHPPCAHNGRKASIRHTVGGSRRRVEVGCRREQQISTVRQQVSAQRRSSRHQVGSCEDHAANYLEKGCMSFCRWCKVISGDTECPLQVCQLSRSSESTHFIFLRRDVALLFIRSHQSPG